MAPTLALALAAPHAVAFAATRAAGRPTGTGYWTAANTRCAPVASRHTLAVNIPSRPVLRLGKTVVDASIARRSSASARIVR